MRIIWWFIENSRTLVNILLSIEVVDKFDKFLTEIIVIKPIQQTNQMR